VGSTLSAAGLEERNGSGHVIASRWMKSPDGGAPSLPGSPMYSLHRLAFPASLAGKSRMHSRNAFARLLNSWCHSGMRRVGELKQHGAALPLRFDENCHRKSAVSTGIVSPIDQLFTRKNDVAEDVAVELAKLAHQSTSVIFLTPSKQKMRLASAHYRCKCG